MVGPGDPTREVEDRYGLDESSNPNHLGRLLGWVVPQRLARRAVAIEVTTDRDRYAAGQNVTVTIEFRNRLPLPITVETPTKRLWGWSVDGHLEASDEGRRPVPEASGALSFRSRERKRVVRRWDGNIKRVGDPTRWEQVTGTVEIRAFLALGGDRPDDRTTVHID